MLNRTTEAGTSGPPVKCGSSYQNRPGWAEEAASFYVSIFRNSKILSTARYGEAEEHGMAELYRNCADFFPALRVALNRVADRHLFPASGDRIERLVLLDPADRSPGMMRLARRLGKKLSTDKP